MLDILQRQPRHFRQLGALSGINREELTPVDQSGSRKGGSPLFAVLARPLRPMG